MLALLRHSAGIGKYLDFLLEVMVIGVPRKASERATEEDLGLWASAEQLGLVETKRKYLEITAMNTNY